MSLNDFKKYNGRKVASFSTTPTHITIYTDKGDVLNILQGTEEGDYFANLLQNRSFMNFRKPIIDIGDIKAKEAREHKDDAKYGLFSSLTDGIVSFFKRKIEPEKTEEVIAEPATNYDHPSVVVAVKEDLGNQMVAVVDGKEIPNVDKLDHYIGNAVNLKDAKGFTALLRRLGAMIDKVDHSVDDVIRFLSTAELSLTDAGDLIVYRVVKEHADGKNIDYRDKYSGKVPQNVGTVVHINPALIDKSRRSSCSAGLHVSTLRYINSFYSNYSNNAILICLVRPEDIIVVPHNENTKVRVQSYRVIGLLNAEETRHIVGGKSLASMPPSKRKFDLAGAIAGNYPPIVRDVLINGDRGGNLTISFPAQPTVVPVIEKTEQHAIAAKTVIEPIAKKAEPVKKPDDFKKLKPALINKTSATARPNHAWKITAAEIDALPTKVCGAVNEVILHPDMSYTDVSTLYDVPRRTLGRWLDKYTTKV